MRSRSPAEHSTARCGGERGARFRLDESGTVTAEFAVVLPGVLLVLALCVGALNVVTQQIMLASLASSAARMLARGDDPGAVHARIVAAAPGARIARTSDGPFVCVSLDRRVPFEPIGIGAFGLSARGCALGPDPLPEGAAS